MTRVHVSDNDNISSAIFKLRRAVEAKFDSRWYKRRFGYFEKPSALERKRKKMKKLVTQSSQTRRRLPGFEDTGCGLWLEIGQRERYNRSGPSNAAGR